MIDQDTLTAALELVVPKEVRRISKVMKEAGYRSWIVGGCLRDVILALEKGTPVQASADWDLATDAHPQEVLKLFRRVIPTGLKHGTVTIVLSNQHFEITTLRGEKGHSDGRRPDEVFFVDDLKEDLARRDFTVNAIAFNLEDTTLHDPFEGIRDLSHGLLRAVGDPAQRFEEDGLRVLRCARFSSTLRFTIEKLTEEAIEPSLDSFRRVALERVRDEWFKALKGSAPSLFFQILYNHGLLAITAEEICFDDSQSFQSALKLLDLAPPQPLIRLALLLCAAFPDPNEAKANAQTLGSRLKLSRSELTDLERLVTYAKMPSSLLDSPQPSAIRRWLHEVGRQHADEILDFQRIISSQAGTSLHQVHAMAKEQLASNCPLSLKDLQISGKDLIERAAVPKGPLLGKCLQQLLQTVLERPEDNQNERLIALAKEQFQ